MAPNLNHHLATLYFNGIINMPERIDWMSGFCSNSMDPLSTTAINEWAWHQIDHTYVLQQVDAVVYAVVEALCSESGEVMDFSASDSVICTKLDIVHNEKKNANMAMGDTAGDVKDEVNDATKEMIEGLTKDKMSVVIMSAVKFPSKEAEVKYEKEHSKQCLKNRIDKAILDKCGDEWTKTWEACRIRYITTHKLEIAAAACAVCRATGDLP